jgi:hypothetical protein
MTLPTHTRLTAPGVVALAALALAALAGSGPAVAQTPLLDLDSSAPAHVLDANEDGGFLVRGTFGKGEIPTKGTGTRLMWYPARAAFRAGIVDATYDAAAWDMDRIGDYSTAFGQTPRASGIASFAAGFNVEASGNSAVAFGTSTDATGHAAFAMGVEAVASGYGAAAFGNGTQASGLYATTFGLSTVASQTYATAFGYGTEASGLGSMAMGSSSVAAGTYSLAAGEAVEALAPHSFALGKNVTIGDTYAGSFAFGDGSLLATSTIVTAHNQFAARAAGGYRLLTNASGSTGVTLAPSGSSWASLSDARAKENFVGLDGRSVLDALEAMPIREWNYIAQDDEVRHIGPTAQEFHAAFGLGSDPLRIETIDADGVALAAIQALIRENRALGEENEALRRRLDDLETRIDRLAALLDGAADGRQPSTTER